MAENKMQEVAQLVGLELEKEFKIKGVSERYKFTEIGLKYFSTKEKGWFLTNNILNLLLTGELTINKIPKTILDEKEKEYLSAVIKPFRKHIITIRKIEYYKYEYIEIVIYRTDEGPSGEVFSFPYFNKGEMYKGMEINKEYALDELGL